MSNSIKRKSREWQTVADLEDIINKMETELNFVNINYIKKMLKILGSIITIAPYKEAGIFSVILKCFRLYLKVYISINPENKKLLKCFERSVPTIITYIIGCLQYKAKKEPNYHYNLLQTLEELLENVQPKILIEISKFDIGTIGCLWNPIDMAGDFNTQSKALKILSVLLKQLDEDRQNEELKCIKWTNLNLFQDKLKVVVQETKSSQVLENSSRELLNNYNMNLSKNLLVYSFHCKTVILDNKYKFYKPLNLKNFWIDVNYCPKTLSFNSRFKFNATAKYTNINVILKIQKMILDNHVLFIYFEKPGEFSKYSNYFSNVTENVMQFSLTKEEVQRLKENYYVIEYFNSLTESLNIKNPKILTENKNAFDLLKNEMSNLLQENQSQPFCNNGSNLFKKSYNLHINSTPEQTFNQEKTLQRPKTNDISCEFPKTSKSLESDKEKLPIRNLRERKKFFTSLLGSSSKEETVIEKTQRKRPQSKKLRTSKSRYKQVCKVIPTLDLTKIENTVSIKQTEKHIKNNITNIQKKNVSKNMSQPLITLQECAEVLKQVADIYDAGDTSYAKPCQSYRNFKVQPNPLQEISISKSNLKSKCPKKKINMASESSPEKKRKLKNSYKQENKENINPKNPNVILKSRHLPQTKIITSPHLFETQHSKDKPPTKKSSINVEAAQTKIITSPHLFETQHSEDIPPIKKSAINVESNLVENMEIDLTVDEMEQFRSQDKISQRENNSSSNSIECETVRGLNENYFKDLEQICTPTKNILNNSSKTTPISTSLMNISELGDTDMELTQIANNGNCKQQHLENNKTNVFTLKEDYLDKELIQFSNWPNFTKQSEIAFEDTCCDIVQENPEVPIWLQRILNCKSPTKATNCSRSHENRFYAPEPLEVQRTPAKDCQRNNTCSSGLAATTSTTNCNIISKHAADNNSANRNYFKDCTVFKNRIDVGKPSSSEDDCNDETNIDVPICLQQILNDFESCSDDELVSNFKTSNKATNCKIISKHATAYSSANRNYFKDCTVFKNRLDVEDSSSSEDDCNYDKNIEVPICVQQILNDFETPNEETNCIIISNNVADNNQAGLNNNKNCITEDSRSCKEDCNYDKTSFYDFKKSTDQQLQIKQNSNQNLCKKNYIKITPDQNNRIPNNLTSTIATECQVTPTAIVMHQIQVSTKKSVIIKNKMPKKTIKASKCLNYYSTNQNHNKSIEFQKEDLALQKQNIDGISSLIHRTNPTDNTNHLKETHKKTKVLELYKISENNGILIPFINANPYEASSIYPATETVYNNTGERVEQQQTSLSSPNFWKEFEYSLFERDVNTSSPYLQNKITNNSKSFKKDLLHIFNDYNKTIKQHLDNAQRQCLKNISNTYSHKLLEIAQAIQKMSDENRMELEKIRCNISRLVRELEWQYDEFIKKTQNFDIHREINKHVFASITSTDIPKSITRDYEELFKQLKFEQTKAFEQVLHTYLEKHKI